MRQARLLLEDLNSQSVLELHYYTLAFKRHFKSLHGYYLDSQNPSSIVLIMRAFLYLL